ncbi:toll-like receptor 13 [Bombina bombina]|uniref:toll-like receptor 13 n=1 Tax=Bombina bombina TaxID=8345 RepID=UPI00235B2D8C|nr:toll-like receptor 13 [Bombina bombina]
MNQYINRQGSAVLTLILQHIILVTAYGFSKCYLAYNNTYYADCTANHVVNLTTAIQYLPTQTKWLNVSQNEITVIQNEAFCHLSNLLELGLGRNKISKIEKSAFHCLDKLYFLDLSYNLIKSLDSLDFQKLTNLSVLNISHNKICTLQNVVFKPLRALKELNLAFNCISDFRIVTESIQNIQSLSKLYLKNNYIRDLSDKRSFVVLPFLQYLNLDYNKISVFDLTYYYLPYLTELSLIRNNMTAINGSSFYNTPILENVYFDENPLHISQLLGSPLHNLTELHWSSMRPALQNYSMACQLFQTLPKLQSLDIKHSKISNNKLQIIGNCTNLTSLTLSTSAIHRLDNNELQTFKNLEVLYLDKCKITKIRKSTWNGLVSLHTLILQRNKLSELESYLFTPLKNLQFLDLSKNHLTYVNNKAFYGLDTLRHLTLKLCNIAFLTKDSFIHLQNLNVLDVSENCILTIKDKSFYKLNKLNSLFLSGNKIKTISKYALEGLKSLKYLSLSENFIYKITNNTFKQLRSLVSLDLRNNQMWSFNKLQSPNPFVYLKHLESLDLSYQMLEDFMIVPRTLLEGLQSLKTLNLRGNPSQFFKNVSFDYLSNLTELDMSQIYQDIEGPLQFRAGLYKKLAQLRYLSLDNNRIRELPEDIFVHLTLLENLSLKNNRLRNISMNILQNLSHLTFFDIYLNPLACSCENYWFQNWSLSNPLVQVPFIQSYNCYGQFVGEINFAHQDFSFCGTDISMFFFIGSFVTTLLLIIVNLLLVKLKWTIWYGYYMLRVWFQWRIQKEKKVYIYDAFISYCSDDELWVMDNLLYQLEECGQHRYKLCFKPRDFMPGNYHIDNIQSAISSSRKTLCVVSKKYLESEWCLTEVQMACSRIFYNKEDVLLMVFLEEIPNYRLSSYHKLRKLIKQNTYIRWPDDPEGEEIFWLKLRKALDEGVYEEDTVQLAVTNGNFAI